MEAIRGCAGVYSRTSAKIANFDYQTQEVEIGRMGAPWSCWGSLTALRHLGHESHLVRVLAFVEAPGQHAIWPFTFTADLTRRRGAT